MSDAVLTFSMSTSHRLVLSSPLRTCIYGIIELVPRDANGELLHPSDATYMVEYYEPKRVTEVPRLTVAIDLLLLWHAEWEAQHGHV